jgi:ferredoxin-NADP reductase
MRSVPEFLPAEIVEATTIAGDVRLLRIRPEHGFAPAEPGSHLDVAVSIGGLDRTRSYSVVSSEGGAWTIAVRRLDTGRGGSRLMATLEAGGRISVCAPKNHFQLSASSPETLLIAGGIGITPIISMARTLARRTAPRLLYAGRARAAMPFLDELAALLGERLSVFADDEGERIDFAAAFAALHPEGEAYICGPAVMLKAARDAWATAGRSPALLRFETFGSGGAREAEAFVVHVRDHGRSVAVPRDASLLDSLAQAGIDLAHDCLRGECGLCVVDVMQAADLDHRCVFLSDEERHAGRKICACVSRAAGEITIDTGFRSTLVRAA